MILGSVSVSVDELRVPQRVEDDEDDAVPAYLMRPRAAVAPRQHRRPGRPPADEMSGEMETRAHILAVARRLFIRRGFADVSVGEVAQAVGVTKPTLYYYFKGKEGLYAAVLMDLMREVGGYMAAVAHMPGSVRKRLTDLATGYFVHADGTMEPMLRDTAELLGEERAAEVWRTYHEAMLTPLTALMREGIRSGEVREADPDVLVRGYLGLLTAFTETGGHTARTPEQHLAVARTVVSLFLDGAAPRG